MGEDNLVVVGEIIMKRVILIVALMVMMFPVQVFAAAPGKVENRTMIYNGHTYQLFENSKSWTAAKANCERLGGHLVTITSRREQRGVEKLLKKAKKYNYWIGLRRNSKGVFSKWITGEKVTFTNWDDIEPNNEYGKENCGSICSPIHPKSYKRNEWNDLPKNGTYSPYTVSQTGFICEWDSVVYTIQYNTMGGKQPDNQVYTYKKSKGASLKNPVKEGYEFAGWYTDRSYSTKITKIPAGSTRNYMLYAKWQEK